MRRRALVILSILAEGSALAGSDECATRWTVEGIALGGSMEQTRSSIVAASAKPGRVSSKASYFTQPLRRADQASFELGAQGKDENAAVVDRLVFVRPAPEGGGDAFLNHWKETWGEPAQRTIRRDDDRVGAISEAWIWLDFACDIRAVVLVRREITPRGAVLRYGTVELRRVSSIAKELEGLERTADRLTGL